MNALVENNSVFDFNYSGIEVFYDAEGSASPGDGGTLNITIRNNTITDAVGGAEASLAFIGDDTVNSCMDVTGNTLNNPEAGEYEIVLGTFQAAGSTVSVANLGGVLTPDAIEIHWAGTQTTALVPEADVKVFEPFGAAIVSVASCPLP